ncbi:MAG: hypothetical protein DRH57_08135 [Candidatus Cloacimonadota bacterium]|nr:MAG: hypothetical protein DRH57_08135 [Candidatus Cloacimonadota bacterium]
MIVFETGDLVKHVSDIHPLRFGYITGEPYISHRGILIVHAKDPHDKSPTIFTVSDIVKNFGRLELFEFKYQYPEEQI